ncbi:hypothetical protein Cgig2_002522 [Carnegiea gigantea]|uniref:Bifunctional inhibitor/plant lipid transfer protein/seed storage helical domain-containing protein n=1 Tax=Carnegiea gigantea TaxID=171969 RepID=A0A9Q1KT71_9CARY|nr:hypothetical protein Cgig2_002522 [Carnegiea gigantea]
MVSKLVSLALFLALNLMLCNLAFSSNPYLPPMEQCPEDTLKLKVCVDVLNGLLGIRIGGPPQMEECCGLIRNIINLDAAACLCTAVHANILDIIKLDLPIKLSLLVTAIVPMATKIASLALFLALNLMLCNLAFSSNPYLPPIEQCPGDILKLKVCVDVLNGLLGIRITGPPPMEECCGLIRNIINLNAAACLCTAVHANILNIIKLNLPIELSLLVNQCTGHGLPSSLQCLA